MNSNLIPILVTIYNHYIIFLFMSITITTKKTQALNSPILINSCGWHGPLAWKIEQALRFQIRNTQEI